MDKLPVDETAPPSGLRSGIGQPWFAATVTAAALLALVGLALFAIHLSGDALRMQAERRLAATAAASAVAVEQNMHGLTEVVDAFTIRRNLIASLKPSDGGRPQQAELRRHLEDLRAARMGIAVAFVTDPAGVLIDILPHTPGIVSEDFSSRDWYRGVTAKRGSYVSELYETAAGGGGPITAAASPVVAADGSTVGILVAGYRPDTIQSFVDDFAVAQGAHLTVVDQAGHVVAGAGAAPTKLVSRAGHPAVAAVMAGGTGLIERESEGEAALIAYAPIRSLGWTLTAEVPQSAALAGLDDVKHTVLLATLLFTVVIGTGGAALARSLRRRGRSEQALAQSQTRLSLALDASGLGVWDLRLPSNTIIVSEEMRRMYDLTEGATVDDVFGRIHPDDRPRVESAVEDALRHDVELDLEYRLITPAGGTRRIAERGMVHRDGSGRPIHMTGVVADITERARGEELFRRLVQAAPVPAVLVKKDGSIVLVNDRASELFLYREAELVGKNIEILLPETSREIHDGNREDFWRVPVARDMGAGRDVFASRKDGSQFPAEIALSPFETEQGMFVIAAVLDVTERRRNEEMIRDARIDAERANQAKNEFLSRMSHELRTPLTAVLGFGELLLLDGLRADQQDYVNRMVRAGRHLLDLVNDVLDIATIEAGRFWLSIEPVAVADVMGEAVGLLQAMAQERGITMTSAPPPACPVYVLGDRQRLKQVLVNLLANAVKYNRDGGEIELTRTTTEESVRVSIRDTGPGISAEHLDLLFVPFERLGAAASGVPGTGLGLSLSQRLVHSMGGALDVESTVGGGSTFSVTLARVAAPIAPTSTAAEPVSLPSMPARTNSVLYIEDNLSNITLIERILAQRPNVSLLTARQGQLGIDLALLHAPDIILLDLNLPDMTGMAVLRRLQAEPATTTIPVVVVSADATPGQIARLLAAGAADYLTKPFNIASLLAILDGLGERPPPLIPASTPNGILDMAVVAELRALVKTTWEAADLLDTFRHSTEVALRDLVEAITAGDRDRIRSLAHTLRGSSASLGAKRLATLCAELEERSADDEATIEPRDARTLARARYEALNALSDALAALGPT